MRFLVLQLVVTFGLAGVLMADDLTTRSLTASEQAGVKHKLEAFEKGQINLDNLTDSPESSLELIKYYVLHTNEVTTKMKLPISKSFAAWSKYPEAAKLAQDYVSVYSNDWRGWSMLGGCRLLMKSYNEAIDAYTNAVRLGDKKNIPALGFSALAVDRLAVFENMALAPMLTSMNDVEHFPEKERIEMKCLLIAYSLKTDKKEVFIKTLAETDTHGLSDWKELKDLVLQALQVLISIKMLKCLDICIWLIYSMIYGMH